MEKGYSEFLKFKQKNHISSGFNVNESDLNDSLFSFQKYIVVKACDIGRYAIFADCGLGKTLMQLEWAIQVNNQTDKPILILAPLAVVEQTIQEAFRFGYEIARWFPSVDADISLHKRAKYPIYITNYEQLHKVHARLYSGVVLDESSILKGKDGKLSALLIDTFKDHQYKLCCTATPSPNDHMELGQHSAFLNAMSYQEMLAMFFAHDGGETSKWRLRKHATDSFWKFVCTWSISLDNPKTLGFNDEGYELPEINYIEHFIPVQKHTDKLFQDVAVSATDINKDLRLSLNDRVQKAKEIIDGSKEQWIIWGLQNAETHMLSKEIENSINLQGSDSLLRKKHIPSLFTNKDNECQCQKKNKESNTQKNITKNTSQGGTTELMKKKLIGINAEGKNTQTTKNTESQLKNNLEIQEESTKQDDLRQTLKKDTELILKSTKEYLKIKKGNAQYVNQNHHSSKQNKDSTLTIATKQVKSEDCCVSDAILDWEISEIQKDYSHLQRCICCGKLKQKVLITKTSIMSFGINAQNCHNMIFCSYDFKFEAFYQAVRRCYRFGQNKPVSVHLLIPETQQNVRQSILIKEKKHFEMIRNMSMYSAKNDFKLNKSQDVKNKEIITDNYRCINGDCIQKTKNIKDNTVDLIVFSPPFAELYVYSDKLEDMGNSSSYNEFKDHFKYLIPELKRTLKPGRICAIHCMDLPIQKGKHGFIGLRDFSGMIEQMFTKDGFIYHARTTIWKNPVTEMQRTKALGLLHKQIKKDSVMSRVGIPDYILFFRNEGENEIPITHQDVDPSKSDYLPVDLWQKYASPVWMDINYSRTLQYTTARDSNDEKHICPLQLDTIERIIHLYSNEGETVFSPFGGIGSEGFQALKMNRKSISIELKESYFNVNAKNHKKAVELKSELTIF